MNDLRKNKGKSLIDFPNEYVVLDLETTGLSSIYDEIIEIAAVKVKDKEIVDSFCSLVKPNNAIPDFITDLTGITNNMVKSAPSIENILPNFLNFIGNEIIVGHNVNFDINFLYDYSEKNNKTVSNDFIDTLRISRKLLQELSHHRLCDIVDYFKIKIDDSHRALSDCKTTFQVLKKLEDLALSKYATVDDFKSQFKSKHTVTRDDIAEIDISSFNIECDETSNVYGNVFVFTGSLDKMKRDVAKALVVAAGGDFGNGVNKKTNYLVLGNFDYCSGIKNGKTTKQKKAEELKLKGNDIEIITEDIFYEMLGLTK